MSADSLIKADSAWIIRVGDALIDRILAHRKGAHEAMIAKMDAYRALPWFKKMFTVSPIEEAMWPFPLGPFDNVNVGKLEAIVARAKAGDAVYLSSGDALLLLRHE